MTLSSILVQSDKIIEILGETTQVLVEETEETTETAMLALDDSKIDKNAEISNNELTDKSANPTNIGFSWSSSFTRSFRRN